MRRYPVDDPGSPDLRSPGRFIRWVAARQARSLAAGMWWGILWMAAQALAPLAVGRALDEGVRRQDTGALVRWSLVLLGLGVITAVAGILRHRCAVSNYLFGTMRCQQLLVRHAVRVGADLPERVSAGEAASVVSNDCTAIGRILDPTARGAGAVVSFFVVAGLLLGTDLRLGLIVLVLVPVLVLGMGPLLAPLQGRQEAQRSLVAGAGDLAADTVQGLRVLRGIGGEAEVAARYRAASQEVRRAGVAVARIEATLDALQVLLPGALLLTITVLGARAALDGDILPGQLVSFCGYAAFLVLPLRTATELADKLTRSFVAAGRILDVLRIPVPADPATNDAGDWPAWEELVDPTTGVRIARGRLTVLACDDAATASALLGRLGGAAILEPGAVALASLARTAVRRRVLLGDTHPWLFRGTVADLLDPHGAASGAAVEAALATASAHDIVDGLAEGLATELSERATELSGGQRQRLALARCLVADPDVLLLDDPTSAVDAHTEARIATALRTARSGRTTVVTSTSPLVLEHADVVVLVRDGRAVATGTHAGLVHDEAYRWVVARTEAVS